MNRPHASAITGLIVVLLAAACGSAAGGLSTQSASTAAAHWAGSVAPADPGNVIVAQNVMAAADPVAWGGKQGDQVFLAQTRNPLTGPEGRAADWEGFVLAGEANAQPGANVIGVGVSSDPVDLRNGRPGYRFHLDPTFRPVSDSQLRDHITATADDLGLRIDSLQVSDTSGGPMAIVTATVPSAGIASFVRRHPGIAVELAGGPNAAMFAQVLGDNGNVGLVDATYPQAETEFRWVDPGIPGCFSIGC
jgi:hypothetical protein